MQTRVKHSSSSPQGGAIQAQTPKLSGCARGKSKSDGTLPPIDAKLSALR